MQLTAPADKNQIGLPNSSSSFPVSYGVPCSLVQPYFFPPNPTATAWEYATPQASFSIPASVIYCTVGVSRQIKNLNLV